MQLLRRTTRRLSLTDSGREYVQQARAAFEQIVSAERALSGRGEVQGRVRLSAPTTYGHYRLPAMLAAFALRYPKVQVELGIANRNVDLVAEGYDLAIRLGTLPDSSLVARQLEEARLCLVAAPAYLARVGTPKSVADLAMHNCLPFVMPSNGRPGIWQFRQGEEELRFVPQATRWWRTMCWAASRWPSTAWGSARPTNSSLPNACAKGAWFACWRTSRAPGDLFPSSIPPIASYRRRAVC